MDKQSINMVAVTCSELFLVLQASERIQTNTERLEYCVVLWDDLKTAEQDVNQWTASSIPELTNSVTNLNDKDRTQVLLATFQVQKHFDYTRSVSDDSGSTFILCLIQRAGL